MTHKILGKNDFYSIYDMKKSEVIEIIENSPELYQPHPSAYVIYKDFFVHPDGPKVSDDYWHGGSYHLGQGADWVAVETSLTDEATVVCNFVYTDWNILMNCTLTENTFSSLTADLKMNYRKCIAKNFIVRVQDNDPNVKYTPLFFLRTEFEQFEEYTGLDMNYERRRVITHQKTYILTRMMDIPLHVPITEDKLIDFDLTGLNELYKELIRYDRTYDEWFGLCFSPYNATPLKLRNGKWEYSYKLLGYRPFLKIVLESTTDYDTETMKETIDDEFNSEEGITVVNIVNLVQTCYNYIPFGSCRRDLLEMIKKDGDHCCCDDCIRDDLNRLIIKLDCVFCGLQAIRDNLDSKRLSQEALNKLRAYLPVIYSQIFGLNPNEPYTKWRTEIYVDETDQFYPNTTGKKNAELRRILWLDVHAQISNLIEATTFVIPYNLYYTNGVRYFGNPNVIADLTIINNRDETHFPIVEHDIGGDYYSFVIEEDSESITYTMVKKISVNEHETTEARFLFWLKQHYPGNCVFNLGTLMNIANQDGDYYNYHVAFLRDDFNLFLPDLRELIGNDIDVVPRIYSELCNQITDLTPEVLNSFYMTFTTDRRDADLQHIFVDTFNLRRMDSSDGIFKVQLTSKKTDNARFVIGYCPTKPTSSHMPEGFSRFETFEGTLSLLNDYVYIDQKEYYKVVALKLTNGYYPLVEIPALNSSLPLFPTVLTRESYLQWFRLVSYIQNTLYTSVHSVAEDCMTELDVIYPTIGNIYEMQVYGVECYDATAVRNAITSLISLFTNERWIIQQLVANANKLKEIFGSNLKKATGNRLNNDGTEVSTLNGYLEDIKTSAREIYNNGIYYPGINSDLINDSSSLRMIRWDTINNYLVQYFMKVNVNVNYIADIRLYAIRPESFDWISEVTMNDNTEGILLSKEELATDNDITEINAKWKIVEN